VATLEAHTGSASNTQVLTVKTLTIDLGTDPSAGKLDLTNNAMIIDYDSSSPIGTVMSLLHRGFDGGAWTGDGITSSKAADHASDEHKTALAYGEASDLGFSTFVGQSVDSTSVVIRYTWYGDANIDGNVDTVDFNILARDFSNSGTQWDRGDFNYDGDTDSVDSNFLTSNFSESGFPT
jgi:hypothetical protein